MDRLEYRVGRFALQPFRQLLDEGAPVSIGRKALDLLSVLAQADGALVTKDELMAAVWPNTIVEDNAIQVHIAALRKLLGQDAGLLNTVHGLGYRLASTNATTSPRTSRDEPRAESAAPPRRRSFILGWPLPALAIVLVAIALAGGGYAWLRYADGDPPAAKAPTIAVLAFQPANGGEDARLFANGLASSVASALSRYDVTVIATSSSLQLTPAQKPQARSLLGADFIVDGRILSNHDKLTVNVEISDTRKNILVHSFDVQDDAALSTALADRIATHLALSLDPGKFLNDRNQKFAASDYALIARLNDAIDGGDMIGAMEPSRRLAERYPDDGDLQANAGIPIIFATSRLPQSQQPQYLRTARVYIERASRLSPQSGLVYFAKSMLVHGPMSLVTQERLLRQSMRLSPTFAPTYNAIGGNMLQVGRMDEGVALMRRSVELDPLSDLVNGDAAHEYVMAGREAEAKEALARAESIWPSSPWVIGIKYQIATYLGAPQDVIALERKYPPQFAGSGIRPADVELMQRAVITRDETLVRESIGNCFETFGKSANGSWDETCLAMMVNVGALDDAFRFAEHAYPDTRALYPPEDDRWLTAPPTSLDTTWLFSSRMEPFRGDPRFWPLAVRTGLVNYWQTTQQWPDFCRGQIDDCKRWAAQAAQNAPIMRVAGD